MEERLQRAKVLRVAELRGGGGQLTEKCGIDSCDLEAVVRSKVASSIGVFCVALCYRHEIDRVAKLCATSSAELNVSSAQLGTGAFDE